ncbi:unnamed protein product, partial [Vitis vinifera]|uniref:Uncharacterized protein n=1 Tax=Vitis vinifera TaxID=29760 RepID=D7TRH0_VITVI
MQHLLHLHLTFLFHHLIHHFQPNSLPKLPETNGSPRTEQTSGRNPPQISLVHPKRSKTYCLVE